MLFLAGAMHGGCAAADSNGLPGLHRGTNIAAWLTGPDRKIYLRDAIEIKNAGFDFVRLPVDPKLFHFTLEGNTPAGREIDFYAVDKAIDLMASAGLAVVLDFHPSDEFKLAVEKDKAAQARFVDFWSAAAAHYRRFPVASLAYQPLNEPQYYTKEADWNALCRRLVHAIREADKNHLVILSAPLGSSVEGLLKLEPIDDPHIAYDFHFYDPYIVTHQGAWWFGDSPVRYLQHVPYPSDRVDRTKISVSPGGNREAAMREVDNYVAGAGWNKARINSRIAIAGEWAKQHHLRLMNLEFGVLLTRTDPASRFRWIKDVREALEANGIGWAVFDYTDSFAIITPNGHTTENPGDGSTQWTYPDNASRDIDPAAMRALGLP